MSVYREPASSRLNLEHPIGQANALLAAGIGEAGAKDLIRSFSQFRDRLSLGWLAARGLANHDSLPSCVSCFGEEQFNNEFILHPASTPRDNFSIASELLFQVHVPVMHASSPGRSLSHCAPSRTVFCHLAGHIVEEFSLLQRDLEPVDP